MAMLKDFNFKYQTYHFHFEQAHLVSLHKINDYVEFHINTSLCWIVLKKL